MTLGILPPTNLIVTEDVNSTVEYCVAVTVPDITDPIERSDFFVCVSTVDGTAMGKNNPCMTHLASFPAIRCTSFVDSMTQKLNYLGLFQGLSCFFFTCSSASVCVFTLTNRKMY